MNATALVRLGRNVSNLAAAAAFYQDALGFQPAGPAFDDPALAALLGVKKLRALRLRRGAQEIELSECSPPPALRPPHLPANDLAFQHIALPTADIAAAARQALRLGAQAISPNGPVRLPASSGGMTAFKFRDPEGHPLEFLEFPAAAGHSLPGFDHSAISVSNLETSIAFYTALGLSLGRRQLNQGPEQDSLDALPKVAVDVVALLPPRPVPHLELLAYRSPRAGPHAPYPAQDLRADRLVFSFDRGGPQLMRDPDGHVILADDR